MKVYRDQFGSDLIEYSDSLKTKKELTEVIYRQINHNKDRQAEDERALEDFARELGLDL